MDSHKNRLIRFGFILLSVAVLCLCSIHVLQEKESLFLDEYSSFGCANGTVLGKEIPYESRVTYTQEEILKLTNDTYAVTPDMRFRFDNVWANLANNVHPPVFYAALHFLCSLTPGVYGMWQPYVINIFFSIILLFFFQKFTKCLTDSVWLSGILCLLWSGTIGFTASVVFLRDYTAAMCACLIAAWECCRYLKGNRRIPDLIKIAFASAFAVLCHYYCAIYIFFLCAVMCVILMLHKNWKSIVQLIISEIGAAIFAVAVFPSLITCMFLSRRGTEATENFTELNASSFKTSLEYYFKSINSHLFGNMFLYLGIIIVLLLLVSLILTKKHRLSRRDASQSKNLTPEDILLLIVPVLGYYVVVSKIAPYQTPRYMYPVYSVMYLSLISLITYALQALAGKRVLAVCMSVVMLSVSVLSWHSGNVLHLYRGMNQTIEDKLEPYRGIDAIQIWSSIHSLNCVTIPEYSYFDSVTFFYKSDRDEILSFPAFSGSEDLMLLLAKTNKDDYVQLIQEAYPYYEVTELGNVDKQGRFINYYLHNTGKSAE